MLPDAAILTTALNGMACFTLGYYSGHSEKTF